MCEREREKERERWRERETHTHAHNLERVRKIDRREGFIDRNDVGHLLHVLDQIQEVNFLLCIRREQSRFRLPP